MDARLIREHPPSAGLGAPALRAFQARLTELKTRYDPGNFFRFNQNIRPRSGG